MGKLLSALLTTAMVLQISLPSGIQEMLTPSTQFTIDISIAGDCMLATSMGGRQQGSFNWYAANYEPSYFFEKVYDIFSADDFTLVNLENVLTDRPLAETVKDHDPAYWYRGPASNARILTAGSIEYVSLANNHVGDYGAQGKRDTIAALEAEGIPYGTNDVTMYYEKNGFTIAIICHGLWVEGQEQAILKRIQAAEEKSDFQIVFYHGGRERVYEPEAWRVRASRRLVDGGADLVIGNHPHVLQPAEVYHGVNILYSVGNFCFGGGATCENRTVICKLLLTVDQGQVLSQEVSYIPCYVYTGKLNNWQPAPITDEDQRQRVLDFLAGKAASPL